MKLRVFGILIFFASGSLAWADQLILDDLVVNGSACVGTDCVNGEPFGFDTLKLKENNLRIKFEDTSNSGGFPSNDWQITANDSASGGANKFSIEDVDGGRTPFTIRAGAPNNALYVTSSGRVGFGTATPVLELHTKDGDSPALRLEQDGSRGFTPQTWDVGGNEANFFIRDATGGSQRPFRIRPGAPENSIYIASDGDVGMGNNSPAASLHVMRGGASILVEDTTELPGDRKLFELRNEGTTRFRINPGTGPAWDFLGTIDDFVITQLNGAGNEFQINGSNGNLTIRGLLVEMSDVNSKENITPVNGEVVLAKLEGLPIATWTRKGDKSGTRHVGPMAQDFHKRFGLGSDERYIATLDMAGVALAGIKELQERAMAKDAKIAALEAAQAAKDKKIAEMTARLATIENAVARLAAPD